MLEYQVAPNSRCEQIAEELLTKRLAKDPPFENADELLPMLQTDYFKSKIKTGSTKVEQNITVLKQSKKAPLNDLQIQQLEEYNHGTQLIIEALEKIYATELFILFKRRLFKCDDRERKLFTTEFLRLNMERLCEGHVSQFEHFIGLFTQKILLIASKQA